MEVWKDIYSGYQVSNLGRVKSLIQGKEKILSQRIRKGYALVQLWVEGKQIYPSVHRLVAKAFIENGENKPQINHINGIKTDNRAENLEWCTASENQRHRFDVLGREKTSKRAVVCIDHNKEYASVKEASMQSNVNSSSIVRCCKGKVQTAGGYHWKYVL